MVVELDLSPDCEAALMAAAQQAGRTVDETVNLAVQAFVEQQATGIRGRHKDQIRIPDEGLPKPFTTAEWDRLIDGREVRSAR